MCNSCIDAIFDFNFNFNRNPEGNCMVQCSYDIHAPTNTRKTKPNHTTCRFDDRRFRKSTKSWKRGNKMRIRCVHTRSARWRLVNNRRSTQIRRRFRRRQCPASWPAVRNEWWRHRTHPCTSHFKASSIPWRMSLVSESFFVAYSCLKLVSAHVYIGCRRESWTAVSRAFQCKPVQLSWGMLAFYFDQFIYIDATIGKCARSSTLQIHPVNWAGEYEPSSARWCCSGRTVWRKRVESARWRSCGPGRFVPVTLVVFDCSYLP